MTAETLDKVITKISPFSGKPEDWEGWRCKFEAVLYGKDMLGDLTSSRPVVGGSVTQANLNAWKEKDKALFYQLILNTSGAALQLVQQFKTDYKGQDAWNALVEKYEGGGDLGAVDLIVQLLALKMDESEDPDLFFVRVESLQVRLKALGLEINERLMRVICIVKLPPNYATLRVCVQANRDGEDAHPLERFKERVRLFWRTNILLGEGGDDDGDAPESDVAKAFVAKGGAGKRGVVCHGCGEPGHVKPDCPKGAYYRGRGKDAAGSGVTPFRGSCYVCGKGGHKAFNCPERFDVKQKKKEQEERVNAAYVEEDMVDEETISL